MTSIRRLNLTSNSIAGWLTDDLLEPFHRCSRVERLTLTGASRLSTQALKKVVGGMPALVAVDLSQVAAVEEQVMVQIARRCDRLQGMNLSGCKMVGDEGMSAIAGQCGMLRRVRSGSYATGSSLTFVGQARRLSPPDRYLPRPAR